MRTLQLRCSELIWSVTIIRPYVIYVRSILTLLPISYAVTREEALNSQVSELQEQLTHYKQLTNDHEKRFDRMLGLNESLQDELYQVQCECKDNHQDLIYRIKEVQEQKKTIKELREDYNFLAYHHS